MELPIDTGAFPLSLKISPFNAIGFTKVDPMEIILPRARCGSFAYSVAPTKAKGVSRFRVLSLSRDASLRRGLQDAARAGVEPACPEPPTPKNEVR